MRIVLLRPKPIQRQRRRFLLPSKVAAGTIAITAPVTNQWKRAGTGSVNFTVSGTYTGSPTAIEISSGGAYATLDAAPAAGSYTGTISLGNSDTDYTLTVRFSNDTGVTASVVGIAAVKKVVAVLEQSNGAGRGTSNQTARTNHGDSAHKMKRTGYANLADPTGTDGSAAGSYALHVVTTLGALLGERLGIVNRAVGGTKVSQWQKGDTQYDDLLDEITLVNGADIFLCGPCESDAIDGTTAGTYTAAAQDIVDDMTADMAGFGVVPIFLWRSLQLIVSSGGGSASLVNQAAINDGIDDLVSANPGMVYHAEVRSIPAHPDDAYHWFTDQQLADVGAIFAGVAYQALTAEEGGSGPVPMIGSPLIRSLQ